MITYPYFCYRVHYKISPHFIYRTIHKLHEIKETLNIAPPDLFGALYVVYLGKSYGPKIGWFLSVLDKDFVLKRLEEATA